MNNKKSEPVSSDVDEDDVSKISQEAEDTYVTVELKENIIKYCKIDDVIRKKQDEIKELKKQKKPCEDYIIQSLERHKETIINMDKGQLIKTTTETKGALKLESIKEALNQQITTQTTGKSEVECKQVIDKIATLIEQKRPVTKKTNLKRKLEKEKKPRTKKEKVNT